MQDIFSRQPDPLLYYPSNGHIATPTMDDWNVQVSGERGELKIEYWKHPETTNTDLGELTGFSPLFDLNFPHQLQSDI